MKIAIEKKLPLTPTDHQSSTSEFDVGRAKGADARQQHNMGGQQFNPVPLGLLAKQFRFVLDEEAGRGGD